MVCRQLGYPVNGDYIITSIVFYPLTGAVGENVMTREAPVNECYSCMGNELSLSECSLQGNQYWTISIRVGCRSHEQVCDNATLATGNGGIYVSNCETDSRPGPTTIAMGTTNEQGQLSTNQSSTGRQCESDTTTPWVITGLLAVVLQATVIGWIVSCICLHKRQR